MKNCNLSDYIGSGNLMYRIRYLIWWIATKSHSQFSETSKSLNLQAISDDPRRVRHFQEIPETFHMYSSKAKKKICTGYLRHEPLRHSHRNCRTLVHAHFNDMTLAPWKIYNVSTASTHKWRISAAKFKRDENR